MKIQRGKLRGFLNGLLLILLACRVAAALEDPPPPGSVSDMTPEGSGIPLLVGITVHSRLVSTDSRDAQTYFNQGLNLAFAFNHDEAIRSFEEAARFDSECAMAWWGIALCHGPHINNAEMDEARSAAAWTALEEARSHSANVSPKERGLIAALGARYVADASDNVARREDLDARYSAAMQKLHEQYEDDTDIAVLYAESLMDLRPWDLWSDAGDPRPETPVVLSVLEHVLEQQPNHPGANHLYIHAVEASLTPQKGITAADRLRTLMPGSGHMVHMPAHIYVRVGRWSQAARQNELAMQVDTVYRGASPQQGFYELYMLHNPHFLAFVCMMEGRYADALNAARTMLSSIPASVIEQSAPLVDPYMSIEYQVLLRFGKWEQILSLPAPPATLPMTRAMWRFARATAYAARHEMEAADREQALFREAVLLVSSDTLGAISPARDILNVGEHVLAGEIAYQKGDFDQAIAELETGVSAEERLLYMEPPEWIQPVRHSLGAVLIKAERWEEAERVYVADLRQWPENGWALWGLARCLKARRADSADEVMDRFRKAWAAADTQIAATCLCVE